MQVKYLTSTLQVINILQIGQPGPDEREEGCQDYAVEEEEEVGANKEGRFNNIQLQQWEICGNK